MEDLTRAKIILYHLLLQKDTSTLTPNEIDIMFNLCKDDDIQKFLTDKS